MKRTKHTVLVLGTVAILVGMGFAAIPVNTLANGTVTLAPSVTKGLSDTEVYFGSVNTETTVTIEVTGNGGTSTTITPMDVVFAIDSSGSMAWNDEYDLRLDAVAGFLGAMDDSRDTAGVVSWDYYIDFAEGLMSDFDDTDGVEYWIYQVDAYGGTNLNVGLNEAIDMLDGNSRTGASSEVIIFLTDGQGTYTTAANGGPASEAAASGYVIYSIGLGLGYPYDEPLKDMASATGGAYFSAPTAENLEAIYDDIYDAIVISTQPHDVDVFEVLEEYIVLDEDSFNIEPDSITYNLDGTTAITWLNVGQYVGDYDNVLSADETVTLTFDIMVNKAGYHMEVQVEDEAIVTYDNSEGTYVDYVDIPQAYINGIFTATLIAGGGNAASAIDVGDVYMWQDEDYLYVNYVTVDGWEMTETHLHVADDVASIPQTKKGNPKVGKFDYKGCHDPAVSEYTYAIDWTWGSDAILYIAAHAVVQKDVSLTECTDPTYQRETAWGDGTGFVGNNWAMYMVYVDP